MENINICTIGEVSYGKTTLISVLIGIERPKYLCREKKDEEVKQVKKKVVQKKQEKKII